MINVPNSQVSEFRTAPVLAAILNTLVLKRVDDGFGGSAVAPATGAAGEDIVGISHINPLSGSQVAVVGEEHSAVANKFTLLNTPITGSVKVYNVTKAAKATVSAVTGGQVTTTGVDDTDILLVSYRRSQTMAEVISEGLPLASLNRQRLTDTQVEFASGKSVVHIDVFDTAADWTIGAPVYANAEGLATTTKPGDGATIVGTVATVPLGAYPWLGISGDWKF